MSGPRRRQFVGPIVSRVTSHGGRGTPYLRRWALIIALAELRVAGGFGRALALQEDLEDLGLYADEAREQELVERCRHGGRLVDGQERGGDALARGDVDARRGDE